MKCSKKVVALSLVATLMFSSVVSVFAADTDVDSTKNHIEFEAGGGTPTDPIDPEDPDVTVIPDDKEEETGNVGTLRLDVVPRFEFGKQNIVGGNKSFYAGMPKVTAGSTTTDAPYYAQVTDVRGTGAGWTLSAKMTKQFTDTTDATHELDGAQIVLSNVAAEAQTGTTVPSTVVATDTLEYDANNETTIDLATAGTDEGMGVTAVRFGDTAKTGAVTADTAVNLTIPGTTQVYTTNYEATIKWTLTTAP